MPWEVWWARPSGQTPWLMFESEKSALAFFKSLPWSKIAFNPEGNIYQEQAGLFDLGAAIRMIRHTRYRRRSLSSLSAGRWSVCYCMGKGVRFLTYSREEDAHASFKRRGSSKVTFNVAGLPVSCVTAPNDSSGLGVALIMKLWKMVHEGEESSPLSAADAIKVGEMPFIPPDRSPMRQRALSVVVNNVFNRRTCATFGCPSYPNHSICFYDVKDFPGVEGFVALTIDDAPCPLGRENSMAKKVQDLLEEFQAFATFMIVGKFVDGHEEDMVDLLQHGHEFGNHGMLDKAYHNDSMDEFADAVDACTRKILELQELAGVSEGVSWFRAPHAKYTAAMEGVIAEQGLHHVLCDTYACCPVIQDGAFIGESLAKSARDGSIIVIHMPSVGVREWCYEGLVHLLLGLQRRGLRAVTVGELVQRAELKAQPLQLQWMWSQGSGFMAKIDPFGKKWGSRQPPKQICEDLDRQTQQTPVKVRAAGQPHSRQFSTPGEASRWIHERFVEEFSITLRLCDSDSGPLKLSVDNLDDCQILVIDVVPKSLLRVWNEAHPDEKVKPGDQIVEVNHVRGNISQLRHELESCSASDLMLKLCRGRMHMVSAVPAIMQNCMPSGSGATTFSSFSKPPTSP